MAKSKSPGDNVQSEIDPNSRATVSGPAEPKPRPDSNDDLTAKMAGTQDLAATLPFNANKPLEYDPAAAVAPRPGVFVAPDDPIVGSSTVQEKNGSEKVGSGGPVIGENKTIAPLDRVRVDSSKRTLTTNQGVPVGDNQSSLKAGLRGPTLPGGLHPPREDHPLRSRAHPRADRSCARLGRPWLLRMHQGPG